MENVFACILAGGSGERFWPLSRRTRPKHLLRLFSERTLLEETVRRLEGVLPWERIFIFTNHEQLEATREALPFFPPNQIIAEPAKRDTAAAAALATALVRSRNPRAVLALLSADAWIRDVDTFRRQFVEVAAFARENDCLVTFGVRPAFPATGFGYLEQGESIPLPASSKSAKTETRFFQVKRFVEKPDASKARSYFESGNFFWNAGMFFWRADAFLEEVRKNAPELARFIEQFPKEQPCDYVREKFHALPKISVDYAVMEKASSVVTAEAAFDWDDVGTWLALPHHWEEDALGNTSRGSAVFHRSENNIVVGNGRIVALCGVKDLVVVETPDAVLVCHRDSVQEVKHLMPSLPEKVV